MFTEIMKTIAIIASIICFTFIAEAQVCQPAHVGLVSWWSGDGNALDARSRHSASGGADFAAGQVGQSFTLNGSQVAVVTSPSALNDPFPVLSIEAWVNPASHGADPSGIFGKTIISNTNGDGFALRLLNGVIQSDLRLAGGDARATFGPVLPLNTFSHIALTYDGANVRAFLNGVQVGSNLSASGTVRNSANSGICLFVGGDPSPACSPDLGFGFDGRIDEVSFYNRALSSSEIAAIHAASTAGKCKPTATVSPSGQVGWWAGDGNTNDIAGTSSGTLQNGAGFSVSKVGQGFRFDGIDDVVTAPQPNPITSSFTAEAWINPVTLANNPVVFEREAGSVTNRFGLQILGNGTMGGYLDALGGFNVSGGTIPTNTFTHVVYLFDDSANSARLYLNGLLVASATETRTPTGSAGTLNIGDSPTSPSNEHFQGQIDEFSLYNRALTDAEIVSIFNAGIAGKLKERPTIDTNSLVSLWKGENNANDTRGVNNGTLTPPNSFASGRIGQAFNFANSSPPGVIVPDNVSLNPQVFTIEAWITAGTYACPGGSNTCQGFIIDKSGSNGLFGYSIGVREAGTLRFLLNGGSGGADIITTQSVADGSFHHVAASYDGATMRVFVDGVLIAQRAVVTTISYQANSQFHIGSRQFLMTGSTVRHPGKIDEAAIYNRALSAAEVRANFEAGNALSTKVGDATIAFPSVTTAGSTQQIPLVTSLFPALPMGTHTGLIYDIATSAVFTGSPNVCFNLPSFGLSNVFSNLRVMHLESGAWQNRTTTSDFPSRTLCSQVTSLSPFAIVNLSPTAAAVRVSGRVTSSNGNGIGKVTVTIEGGDLEEAISVQTNPFGYYRFDGLEVGHTYVVSVSSKQYAFTNPTRVINLLDEVTDADFVADSP